MADFRTPLRDMRFLLYDVFDFEAHYARLSDRERVTRDLLDPILEEAARFAETELFPINRTGDERRLPFRERRRDDAERIQRGVSNLRCQRLDRYDRRSTAYGGQALPHSMSLIVEEPMTIANMAWTMYPDLSHSAMNALERHGTPDAEAAISDVAAVGCMHRHDVPDRTAGRVRRRHSAHQRRCRMPTARTRSPARRSSSPPANTTSSTTSCISFLRACRMHRRERRGSRCSSCRSSFRATTERRVARNGVQCTGIEEKMGIHGNATCVLNFDGATGFLVGAENEGMRCMFTMMNAARLGVGMQGVGVAEAAYQASLAYARERLQMRAVTGPQNPNGPADPIIVHPDVRRMLLTQKALIEGGRALAYLHRAAGRPRGVRSARRARRR